MVSNTAEFRFLTIKCKTCGFDFVITPSEQKWFRDSQLSIPVHCLECRQKRKQAKLEVQGQGGERNG